MRSVPTLQSRSAPVAVASHQRRSVIVRTRFHEQSLAYVARRTAEGKSERDVIRCLKRFVIREVYHLIRIHPHTGKISS